MTLADLDDLRRETTTSPLTEAHHDGSSAYVPEQPTEPGGEATLLVRVPHEQAAERVVLRFVRDGEPRPAEAVVDRRTDTETWWRATVPVTSATVRYRWLLTGGRAGYRWLNGRGVAAHDVADADDFVLSLDPGGPEWHLGSVVYEVFPDRFATSGAATTAPDWAVPRPWDALPTGRGPTTPYEWFGGDLRGIEQHLDHVVGLGVGTIYLTPIFPARSTHRYDGSTFDHVDPLLGGDEALVSLVEAAHRRGLRVVGDLTLNHVGASHDWFRAALEAPDAPERGFFIFDESIPGGYESWLGVRSLPKLDHSSPELQLRLEQVVRRWIEGPDGLDGWRLDVANMTGRFGSLDLNREVARATRAALDAVRDDALLIAEHGHDFRADLGPAGWHGVMNYAGFLRPVWTWLLRDDPAEEQRNAFWGLPVPVPHLDGPAVVDAMRAFRAGVPWQNVLHSWSLVDSHDTARFRTIAGSREKQLVGVGLQMTTPGVPMLFAGSELGLEGAWGEDARRTMPWDRPDTWDTALLEETKRLVALRHGSEALIRGGLRYAHVGPEAIAYLRETPGDRILCLAARDRHEPLSLPLALLGCTSLETLYGADAEVNGRVVTLPGEGPAFHTWRLHG